MLINTGSLRLNQSKKNCEIVFRALALRTDEARKNFFHGVQFTFHDSSDKARFSANHARHYSL